MFELLIFLPTVVVKDVRIVVKSLETKLSWILFFVTFVSRSPKNSRQLKKTLYGRNIWNILI